MISAIKKKNHVLIGKAREGRQAVHHMKDAGKTINWIVIRNCKRAYVTGEVREMIWAQATVSPMLV